MDETKTNHLNNSNNPQPPDPPKIKLERTKSILKQSSKERSEHPELHSPKRENITFAPEHNLEKHLQEKENSKRLLVKKLSAEKINLEVNSVVVVKKEEESESSSESSSSDSDEEDGDEEDKSKSDLKRSSSSPIRRISITRSNSRINFEPVEALAAQKHLPKPAIEKIKRNLLESHSDSSSSTTQDRCESSTEKKDSVGGKKCAKSGLLKTPERGGQSPSIEVTSNPAVTTFVSAQEQR